jgi:hypothetical protein
MTDPSVGGPTIPEEARTWERDCVEALSNKAQRLRGLPRQPEIESVSLAGGFPDTELSVAYRTRSSHERRTRSYPLWKPPFVTRLSRETPDQVALIIYSDVAGSSA